MAKVGWRVACPRVPCPRPSKGSEIRKSVPGEGMSCRSATGYQKHKSLTPRRPDHAHGLMRHFESESQTRAVGMAPRWACHPPFCRTCPTPATGCRGGDALASSRPRAIGRTSSRGTDPTGPAGCTGNPKAGPPGPAGESGPPIPDDTPNPGRYNPHRSDRFSSTDLMRSAATLLASPESFGRTPHKILFVIPQRRRRGNNQRKA